MGNARSDTGNDLPLPIIRQEILPSVADQVFAVLQQRILTLGLPPGTRMSEADVARKTGVSRQPVREAFKRLAKLGFLLIRPQSGTTVSLISKDAVLRARYVRSALEQQTTRTACETITGHGLAKLRGLIEQQRAAVATRDKGLFLVLDDQFHQEICVQAGVGYVWELIHDNKAHMDRVRMLSLTSALRNRALNEHIAILDAITAHDPDAAAEAMNTHLSRILIDIEEVQANSDEWFTESMK